MMPEARGDRGSTTILPVEAYGLQRLPLCAGHRSRARQGRAMANDVRVPWSARKSGAAAALILPFLVVSSCDGPTDPGQTVPPDAVHISEVTGLEAARTAEVRGQNLDRLDNLVVDGVPVTFEPISSTHGRFTTPELRSCETDGRRVQLKASAGVEANARMEVSGVLRLEVGESRILSAEDLECVQLGRGMEAYVLSMANFGLEPGGAEGLFRLHLRGTGEDPPASFTVAAAGVVGPGDETHHHHAHAPEELELPPPAGAPGIGPSEGPFDDYASAQVGDTVVMVDWNQRLQVEMAGAREEVPQFEAVVVAVEGNQMIVADLRTAAGRSIAAGANRESITEAARLVSEVAVPAITHLIGPEFRTPPGAGGRMLTLLEDLPGRAGTVRTPELFRDQRWASHMFLSRLDVNWAERGSGPALARVIAHETGHLADVWASREFEFGIAMSSWGFHQEAFAVAVEDLMARMSRGGIRDVPNTPTPGLLSSQIMVNPHHNPEEMSAWGTEEGRKDVGWYSTGGRILRYAQEQMPEGEEWRLHRALLNRAIGQPISNETMREAWGIGSLAEEIGTTPEELIEATMLADLTHGFVDPEVVAEQGLPRIAGWRSSITNIQSWIGGHRKGASRRRDESGMLGLRPGSYDYRYIAGDQYRGLSIEGTDFSLEEHHQVRITRLR